MVYCVYIYTQKTVVQELYHQQELRTPILAPALLFLLFGAWSCIHPKGSPARPVFLDPPNPQYIVATLRPAPRTSLARCFMAAIEAPYFEAQGSSTLLHSKAQGKGLNRISYYCSRVVAFVVTFSRCSLSTTSSIVLVVCTHCLEYGHLATNLMSETLF